jgi:YgiT-type zinc finger domain-containing protein
MMKCVICKQGQTENGLATVTLERGHTTVVIKDVPAEICDNCGEYYLSEEVTDKVQKLAEQAVKQGAEIEVLRYAA